ncbi:4671_t:CDS:2 [Dentiscutata erythropus]|uniref:4671_t:CDS:1 n=1 Tax=Dentiscutata erythropus TaxID=1348616 RepID=A0A9N9ETT1_9GLOM|nr:4671_t:CDS:2 [Dentiscutata erythropus]
MIENNNLVERQYEAKNNDLAEEQHEIKKNNFVVDTEERENAIEPILGSELEGLDPSNYPLITPSIELTIKNRFSSWKIAKYYLKEYGRQKGFATKRYRVEFHRNRTVKKRTLTCEKAGKYKPNKTKPIGQQRNKGSKRTDCKCHVNLSSSEHTHYVHITFIYPEHNHTINADNKRFTTAFKHFDKSIMAEIEHAVVYGYCDIHMIRNLLQLKFSDQLFLMQDLSNAIQKIKCDKKVNRSDASHLLKFLLNQQKKEPTIFVQPLINVDSNRLCSIFWMTANQILLWSHYFDVVLHDNISRTNKYNFPLSLFILVDSEGKSRLGAQAFLNNETQESYKWVLQQTLDATSSEPNVFITDMDPAMNAACKNIYENTYYLYCIWHLLQNLPKRLKSKLALIEKYPNTYEYLHNTLYPTQQSWACVFVNRIFTVGMQSTQCIESINALIYKEVSSSLSMINVVEAIDSRMQKEALKCKFYNMEI